jgi:hypothetical protein
VASGQTGTTGPPNGPGVHIKTFAPIVGVTVAVRVTHPPLQICVDEALMVKLIGGF